MSSDYKEEYILHRYEKYIECGYSPKDARLMAEEDYEHDSYDYEPEENNPDTRGEL